MTATFLCPRHGQTASVLSCEHVSAAVNCGSEPPAFRHVRVTLGHAETVAYRACFACVKRFGLASEFSAPPDTKSDDTKFPKFHPVCAECLKATRSPRAADLATIRAPSPSTVENATPKQVWWAVLIASTTLLISYVSTLRNALAWRGFGWSDAPREVVLQCVAGLMFRPIFFSVLLIALSLLAVARRVAWARWILFAAAALDATCMNWATAPAICLGLVLAECVSVGLLFTAASSEWFATAPNNR